MANDRPNLLFVFGDQWRAQATGFGGNGDVKTPHLDALAEQSLHARNCAAGSPVCCVWRASMLTGQYPHQHGVVLNDGVLSPEAYTFGEHFAEAGYDTAWVGKWHVDGHGRSAYIPRERQHRFAYWRTLECTHDYNNSQYYADDDPTPRQWEGYDADAQTDDLIGWLRGRESDRPFCAFLSWGPPHNPYHTAPEKYRAMYDPADLTLRPNVPAEMEEKAREMLAGYYAHCTALDDCMGRLLATLDDLAAAENTIVVFTSDHGDMLGSHGMVEKCCPLDESLRVPMLIRWPTGLGEQPGESDVIVDMVDHLPTLSAMCGLGEVPTASGRDLSMYLRQGATPNDNAAVYGSYVRFGTWLSQDERIDPLYRARVARGIRTLRYTYVEDLDGPWMLYDNEDDPQQLTNRANDPGFADLRATLAQRLHDRLKHNGDAFERGETLLERFYPGETMGNNRERRGQ
jgi:arylsulfatase A-like enzyme